jgi:phage baseplate assembly protein W
MPYQIVNLVTEESLNTGIGINLPFIGPYSVFNSTYTTEAQALANLKNLLLTYKGERVFQPSFGTDLPKVLFEPNTQEIKPVIVEIISEAVDFWLPFINLVDIDVITAEDDPNMPHELKITITFSVIPVLGTPTSISTSYDTENNLSQLVLAVNQNQLLVL